jgi:hypothetical protein
MHQPLQWSIRNGLIVCVNGFLPCTCLRIIYCIFDHLVYLLTKFTMSIPADESSARFIWYIRPKNDVSAWAAEEKRENVREHLDGGLFCALAI